MTGGSRVPTNEQIKGVTRRYANEGFASIAPNLFTRHSDLLTEKNVTNAMIPMFSMPREKRNDPTAIVTEITPFKDFYIGEDYYKNI